VRIQIFHHIRSSADDVQQQPAEQLPDTPQPAEDIAHTEHSAEPPPETPHPKGWQGWLWKGGVAVLVAVALSIGGFLYSFDQTFAGRIYPNISVRGVPVGEMSTAEARELIEAHYAAFLEQPIILTYDTTIWQPTLAELGVALNIDAAVARALAAGRSNSLPENLREVAAVWQDGLELPLHMTIDQQTLQQYIVARAAEVDRPAVDAQLLLRDAAPVAVPAVSGRQVLVNQTTEEIVAALQTLAPQTVVMRTRELLPTLRDGDITAAQREVDTFLQGPITFVGHNDQTWEWTIAELADLIQVQRERRPDDSSDTLQVSIDHEQIRARLRELAVESTYGGSYPRLDWNGGDLRIIEPGNPEYRIDEAQTEYMISDALSSSTDRTIELPFYEDNPPIHAGNLDELGITELVAAGRSDFTGSAAYRITNIQAGMVRFDGLLIAPGEEFSFNENVGAIDASNGFVEGYAIVQNRTQLEWGGGICQDSTTMFRAAFWAGLPITERWGHSFYISWYDRYGYGAYGDGPGMDATIFTGPGGPDLKFVNDTDNWLLLDTVVDIPNRLAEIRIYGTKPERTVEFEGPEIFNRRPAPAAPMYVPNPAIAPGAFYQSDTARGGMSIAFTRVIKEDGVEVDRERFTTVFKPWPNIYEVHPSMLGPDGNLKPTPTPTPEGDAYPAPEQQPPEGEEQAPPPEQQPPEGEQPAPPPEPTPAPPPGDETAAMPTPEGSP
jgi:vancomycin resistance protein YoaR